MTSTVLMPEPGRGRPRKHVPTDGRTAVLEFTPTVAAMCRAMVEDSPIREIMCVGTRGDGKTIGVLAGMLGHAAAHQAKGFRLPLKWLGVTDTFSAHHAKTFRSLEKEFWKGCWRKGDGGHVWTAVVNGVATVELHLFGIEDQGAMDRVRTECAGVWFEEPAPTAQLGVSKGLDETTWGMAMTSQRLPDKDEMLKVGKPFHHVAVMTLNYPDEDHWTWQRFKPAGGVSGFHPDDPSRAWFRIPPGERADALQRAEWAHALRDRPDLLRRLIEGQPGSIMLGPQVADGFNLDLHVSTERVHLVRNEPIACGLDFGLTPTMIIGQAAHGFRRIAASHTIAHGGVEQLLENEVLPWLSRHAPWALRNPQMVYGCYDVSGQTGEQSDSTRDPVSILEQKLPGLWFHGPVSWDSRKHVLLSAMHHHARPGQVSLQIDPVDAAGLVKALGGRWHYPIDRQGQVRRDLPKKPNHPWEDYGDAFIYWLWSLTSEAQPPGPLKVESSFSLEPSLHVETMQFS